MPRKKPIGEVHAAIAEAADRQLLDWLQNGKEVFDEGGNAVRRRHLSAADINAIYKRLRDLGIQSPAVHGSAAGGLVDEATRQRWVKFQGGRVPLLDTESPDEATGARG